MILGVSFVLYRFPSVFLEYDLLSVLQRWLLAKQNIERGDLQLLHEQVHERVLREVTAKIYVDILLSVKVLKLLIWSTMGSVPLRKRNRTMDAKRFNTVLLKNLVLTVKKNNSEKETRTKLNVTSEVEHQSVYTVQYVTKSFKCLKCHRQDD